MVHISVTNKTILLTYGYIKQKGIFKLSFKYFQTVNLHRNIKVVKNFVKPAQLMFIIYSTFYTNILFDYCIAYYLIV